MAKTKYDFIRELLEDKKINQSHRERILELASREISLEGTLEERVQKIEEIIFNQNLKTNLERKKDLKLPTYSSLPKYLDPYHLYNFLLKYNQNPILRTTCHDIDGDELKDIQEFCKTENYIFNEHLKKIIDEYLEHEKKHEAPPHVKALIRGYLTGKDFKEKQLLRGWSSENIKINWSSPEVENWAQRNNAIAPNYRELSAGNQEVELFEITPQISSPITEGVIQNFTQLVLHFKNLFHLKSGSQSLYAILVRINSKNNWNEQVEFEFADNNFLNNLEHFTDVDKLIQAYIKLIQLVIEQHNKDEKPKVKLSFYEENQRVYLSIHHCNGQYNQTIENTVNRIGQTYSSLIKNQINGLCNLYLRADFGNKKCAKINLWNGKKREATKLPSFEGVEYRLEFPKTKKS